MSEIYIWRCCGEQIGEWSVVETWPDGTPRAWERRCPCGRGVMTQIDGGTLDLGLLERSKDDNDFEVFA